MEGGIIAAGVVGAIVGAVSISAFIWTYYFRRKDFPPGPRAWPFIGTLYHKDQFEALEEMAIKYGPVFSASKMSVKPCVFVNDFEIFQRDLKPQVAAFARRPQSGVLKVIHMDKGIVYANDEHWQATRAFALKCLRKRGMGTREMYDMIWAEAANLRLNFEKKVAETPEFDPYSLVQGGVINVLARLIFGQHLDDEDPVMLTTKKVLNEGTFAFDTLSFRVISYYSSVLMRLPRFIRDAINRAAPFAPLRKMLKTTVAEKEDTYDKNNPTSVVENFLVDRDDNPNGVMSKEHVLEACVLDLFGAGADTTQNTVGASNDSGGSINFLQIRWSLLLLAQHPLIQEELFEECVRVVGSNRPGPDDLKAMPKFEAFMSEVIRYVVPLGVGLQHETSCSIQVDKYTLPEGTPVVANIYSFHRDDRYWKHPETFRLENFLDSTGNYTQPKAYMPFGWGARVCPGSTLAKAEYFLFVCGILQDYKLSFDGEYKIEPEGDILRRPPEQKIKFTSRNAPEDMDSNL